MPWWKWRKWKIQLSWHGGMGKREHSGLWFFNLCLDWTVFWYGSGSGGSWPSKELRVFLLNPMLGLYSISIHWMFPPPSPCASLSVPVSWATVLRIISPQEYIFPRKLYDARFSHQYFPAPVYFEYSLTVFLQPCALPMRPGWGKWDATLKHLHLLSLPGKWPPSTLTTLCFSSSSSLRLNSNAVPFMKLLLSPIPFS